MSNVTTLAELAASFTDSTAVKAIGAASVSTASMLLSLCRLAVILDLTSGMLVPVT